jgi:hypothetical protein
MAKPVAKSDYDAIYANDADGKISGNLLANDTHDAGTDLFLRFVDGARVSGKGALPATMVPSRSTAPLASTPTRLTPPLPQPCSLVRRSSKR